MADKKPKKDLTREEWIERYGSDTQYYTHTLKKVDLTTGRTLQSLINEAAKKHNIDPAFLASTLFSEGLDRYNVFQDDFGSKREHYNEFAVSGMKHLGLDTIGNRKNELFKKGYIDRKEYEANAYEIKTKNDKKGGGEDVISADFKDLGVAINYVAAFQRNENDILENHLKKNNIELSPLQKTFFQNVAYNAGGGNAQAMVDSYSQRGFLKDDKAIFNRPNDYWVEVHKHAHKRTTAGAGLKEQKNFPTLQGEVNPYQFKVREEAEVTSELTPKGLSADIPTLTRAEQKALPKFATEGLTSGDNNLATAKGNIPNKEMARTKTKSASTIKTTGMAKKTAPTEKELALKEQFVANMQKALGQHESNNKYDAQNPTSSAAGKYQFTERWLKDAGEKSIQAFAERNGMDIPQSLDEFKTMPELQESFFKYYAKEVLYPKAMEAVSSLNPKGITMEQAGALVHLRGEVKAIKEISTGKFSAATEPGVNGAKHKNPSSISYMNSIATKVGQPITPEQLTAVEIDKLPQAEKDKIAKDYTTAVDRITHFEDLDDVDKNRQIAKVNAEYKAKGYIPIVNEHFTKKNEEAQKNHNPVSEEDKAVLNKMLGYAREANFDYKKQNGKNTVSKKGKLKFDNPAERQEFIDFAEANGIKYTELTNFNFEVKNIRDVFKEKYKSATGSNAETKISEVEKNKTEKEVNSLLDPIGFDANKKGKLIYDDKVERRIENAGKLTQIDLLDPELIDDIPQEEKAPLTEETAKADATTTTETGDDAKGLTGGDSPEGESLLDQWARNLKEDIARKDAEGEGISYDKSNFKKDIPFDAITGMALGITGMDQARDTKVPKRTEEVSEAYRNFASELAKKSKEGLPPAVEAAMKAQLAEGLQGGLASIQNASNGNRALVLGNLGGLQKQQAQGIVEMQLADYEAKERAFAQYGDAMKYQSDFKARKDVANHAIDYQEALKRRSDGEDLANAGFAQMIEGLKYQKENGPGSINHQKKSWLEQKMWGFALDAKPDAPNSYESMQKEKAKVKEYSGKQLEASEKLASLNPEQQKMAKQFLETNPSERDQAGLINYLYDNPGKVRMDTTKFAEAKEREDFGLMFQDEEKPVTELSKPEKIESPAIAQLEAMRPNGVPGRATQKAMSLEPNGVQGLSGFESEPLAPRSAGQSQESMANLEEPDDYEFALGQANENQLSYYNKQ